MSRALSSGLLALLAALLIAPALSSGASGATTRRAAVVVQHGDLGTVSDCVKFKERRIDGYELLKRSRFKFLAARFEFGRAICWLDGEGCKTRDPEGCFCDPIRSWSYWTQDEGSSLPEPADAGAPDRAVRDGAVDYWVWGPFGEPPLQPTSVEEACRS